MNDAELNELIKKCGEYPRLYDGLGEDPVARMKTAVVGWCEDTREDLGKLLGCETPENDEGTPRTPAEALSNLQHDLIKACGKFAIEWAARQKDPSDGWVEKAFARFAEVVKDFCELVEESLGEQGGLAEEFEQCYDWNEFVDTCCNIVGQKLATNESDSSEGGEEEQEEESEEERDMPAEGTRSARSETKAQIDSMEAMMRWVGGES